MDVRTIPVEVLDTILSFADHASLLGSAAATCQQWRLASDTSLRHLHLHLHRKTKGRIAPKMLCRNHPGLRDLVLFRRRAGA